MHENFVALDGEKRDRIINASMREFSAKGYKNASTNEIVKNAGISKGALFHYFASKRELFEFLCRYSTDFFMKTIEPVFADLPDDVFERWTTLAAAKMKIAAQYPEMSDFMMGAFLEESKDAQGVLKDVYDRVAVEFPKKIYEGIDLAKFRQDMDIKRVLQIIWWVIESFAFSKQKQLGSIADKDVNGFLRDITLESEQYLSILKKSFYKEYVTTVGEDEKP